MFSRKRNLFLKKKKKFAIFFFFLLFVLASCASNQQRKSPHIKDIETLFFHKEFAKVIDRLRQKTEGGNKQDRLLYLMEAGSVFHVISEWEKSNLALLEADRIATQTYKRISSDIAGYLVNDTVKDYAPETFERILIKLYIAMNYLFLDEREKALRYLQQISIEQRDLRDNLLSYQQNNFARYLYAILAEALGKYNEARVQYNNLLLTANDPENISLIKPNLIRQNLYRIALKLDDTEDITKFEDYSKGINIYDESMKKFPLFSQDRNTTNLAINNLTETGQLVIIYEYGIGPFKASRGRIGNNEEFTPFLETSYLLAYVTKEKLATDAAIMLSILKNAENPIPIYLTRKRYYQKPSLNVVLNTQEFPTEFEDSYEKVVIKNFNDNYPKYVKDNINAILSKAVLTLTSSQVIAGRDSEKSGNSILSVLVNLLGSTLIAVNLKPDLRSWVFTYKDISLDHFHLMPGTYEIKIPKAGNNAMRDFLSIQKKEVTIKKNQTTFVKVRVF